MTALPSLKDHLANALINDKNYQVLKFGRAFSGDNFSTNSDVSSFADDSLTKIANKCDYLLIKTDGLTMGFTLIIDNGFAELPTMAELKEVGSACLQYTGVINGQKMPIHIQIFFLNPPDHTQDQLLKEYHFVKLFKKVVVQSFVLNSTTKKVLTNAPLGGLFVGKSFYQKLINDFSSGNVVTLDDDNKSQKFFITPSKKVPFTTIGLLTLIILVFIGEILTSEFWTRPEFSPLIDLLGLSRSNLFSNGRPFVIGTYIFAHLGFLHFLLNSVCLAVGGYSSENIWGHWKTLLVFIGSGIFSALFSLIFHFSDVLTVGASGAIMGLLACNFASSFAMKFGEEKSKLQMQCVYILIPSLLPTRPGHGDYKTDYAAHFGGAIAGAIFGFLFTKAYRDQQLK